MYSGAYLGCDRPEFSHWHHYDPLPPTPPPPPPPPGHLELSLGIAGFGPLKNKTKSEKLKRFFSSGNEILPYIKPKGQE